MLDQVTGMRVFVRVHAEGSFAAAGRTLRMSQTMVTKHVEGIESRLGVPLMNRSTRGLTLTEAGRSYLRSCFRILAEIEDAEDAATAGQHEARGYLRLKAPVSFGTLQIAPLLTDFLKSYPRVRVELDLNDRLVDLAKEGWDLAIRIGTLPDSNLRMRRLAQCRFVVCAAPSYLEEWGKPTTVADLATHNCLGFTLSTRMGVDHWSFGDEGEVSIPISGNLQCNNSTALQEAARAGLGIVSLPTFLASDDLQRGNLVALPLDMTPASIGHVHAVFPPDRRMPQKTRKMIEFLAQRFGKIPPWDRGISDF